MGFAVSQLSQYEETFYILAERLHMPVYKIKSEMPLEEFMGWLNYYGKSAQPTDLTSLNSDQVAAMFGT